MDGAVGELTDLLRRGARAQLVTLGVEIVMRARRDERYRAVINAADVVVADTIGIVIASRLLRGRCRARVPGIELADRLCAACAREGWSAYLLGGAEGVAETAAAALRARHPDLTIAGTQHGYFSDGDAALVAAEAGKSGARLILVALGFPRQEFFVHHNLQRLSAVCVGVGGAFDVWAGRVNRAPALLRQLGLEWLYRLVREPWRWRRQLVLPQFALYVAAQALWMRLLKTGDQ